MGTLTNTSCTHRIWMAGDVALAKQVVQEYCDDLGDCYAVSEIDYIYSGGNAKGFCVSRIQYPRFAISEAELLGRVNELAKLLGEKLNQTSYTVEGPANTTWHAEPR